MKVTVKILKDYLNEKKNEPVKNIHKLTEKDWIVDPNSKEIKPNWKGFLMITPQMIDYMTQNCGLHKISKVSFGDIFYSDVFYSMDFNTKNESATDHDILMRVAGDAFVVINSRIFVDLIIFEHGIKLYNPGIHRIAQGEEMGLRVIGPFDYMSLEKYIVSIAQKKCMKGNVYHRGYDWDFDARLMTTRLVDRNWVCEISAAVPCVIKNHKGVKSLIKYMNRSRIVSAKLHN